jgi:HJR/Mrr/RecB family endonuclease
MIVDDVDIHELEAYLEEFKLFEDDPEGRYVPSETSVEFFGERPNLLLPLGFDESLGIVHPDYLEEEINPYDGIKTEEGIETAVKCMIDETIELYEWYPAYDFYREYLFRRPTGSWHWFKGMEHGKLLFEGLPNFNVNDLISQLQRFTDTPDSNPHSLWLQKLWTPRAQDKIRVYLTSRVGALLEEIRSEKKSLDEIQPRQLEELIAELLRRRGMDIYVTPKTRDGGRDIIARSEMIPGEPTTLAVEVKHKRTVGIADVRNALNANQDFPVLMVATSGKFSAGVLNLKKRNRYQYRLLLKDGVALSQWLK